MLQQLLGRHQKGKLIWGIILSLAAPFNMLGRRLLVKTAINLAKRANRGCRRSAPRSSRLATPRLPAMIEQHQFWVVWFWVVFFSFPPNDSIFSRLQIPSVAVPVAWRNACGLIATLVCQD